MPGFAGAEPGAGRAAGRSAGVDAGRNAGEAPEAPKKGQKYRAPESRKRLTFSQQREYDTIEEVIDELTARSKKLEEEMAGITSDYVKLQALSEEEEKIERYIELQEIVEG